MGQKVLQRDFLAAGGFVFVYGLTKLCEVVQAFLTAFCAQCSFVAAFIQQRGQGFGDRLSSRAFSERFDKRPELRGFGSFENIIFQAAG